MKSIAIATATEVSEKKEEWCQKSKQGKAVFKEAAKPFVSAAEDFDIGTTLMEQGKKNVPGLRQTCKRGSAIDITSATREFSKENAHPRASLGNNKRKL